VILVSFGMPLFDIYTPLTLTADERTGPEDGTKVVKRAIAMINVLHFQNLLGRA
jgi:hypothetical protein